METIISISSDGFSADNGYYHSGCDGYVIVTTEQTIKIGISNSSSCCEQWDVQHTPDDLTQFIDAELYGIVNSGEVIASRSGCGYDGGGAVTIDLQTSKGTLKIQVSNSHNGYYSHSYVIESNQLKDSGTL